MRPLRRLIANLPNQGAGNQCYINSENRVRIGTFAARMLKCAIAAGCGRQDADGPGEGSQTEKKFLRAGRGGMESEAGRYVG
jgi:hypothetical protein